MSSSPEGFVSQAEQASPQCLPQTGTVTCQAQNHHVLWASAQALQLFSFLLPTLLPLLPKRLEGRVLPSQTATSPGPLCKRRDVSGADPHHLGFTLGRTGFGRKAGQLSQVPQESRPMLR